MGSVPELYKKTSFFIVLTHPFHFFSILQSSTVLNSPRLGAEAYTYLHNFSAISLKRHHVALVINLGQRFLCRLIMAIKSPSVPLSLPYYECQGNTP